MGDAGGTYPSFELSKKVRKFLENQRNILSQSKNFLIPILNIPEQSCGYQRCNSIRAEIDLDDIGRASHLLDELIILMEDHQIKQLIRGANGETRPAQVCS